MTPEPRRDRLSSGVFFFGTTALVLLVGGVAALVTWALHPAPKRPCISNCPPPSLVTHAAAAAGLSELHSFSGFGGIHVDYPRNWQILDKGSNGIRFATTNGSLLEVTSVRTNKLPTQLIMERISQLDPNRFPDLKTLAPIPGARIGTQEGSGLYYQGTYVPQSGGGSGTVVRVGAIVAKRNGLTVLAFAIWQHRSDPSQEQGITGELDYALTEFRWPGE